MINGTGKITAISGVRNDNFFFLDVRDVTIMPHVGTVEVVIPVASYSITKNNAQEMAHKLVSKRFDWQVDIDTIEKVINVFLSSNDLDGARRALEDKYFEDRYLEINYRWLINLEIAHRVEPPDYPLDPFGPLLDPFVNWANNPHPATITNISVNDRVKYSEVDGFGLNHKYFLTKY